MYELAQLNIAHLRAPRGTPLLADFEANLDRINALADVAPGFVWRMLSEPDEPTTLLPLGTDLLANLSTWRDIASLKAYAYQSAHSGILQRRAEWFFPMTSANLVLWWVPSGHRPTLAEAVGRMLELREHGPTARAFSFRQAFPPNA